LVKQAETATVGRLGKIYQSIAAPKTSMLEPTVKIDAPSTQPLDEFLKTHAASTDTVVPQEEIDYAGMRAGNGHLATPVSKTLIPFMSKQGHNDLSYYAGYFGNNAILESLFHHTLAKKGRDYTLAMADTALREAAEGGKLEAIKTIVKWVPEILDHPEACGWALHNAARRNKAEGRAVIQYLFERSPVLQNQSAYLTDYWGKQLSAFDEATRVAYHLGPSKEEADKTAKLIHDLVQKYQPLLPKSVPPKGGEFSRSPNFGQWAQGRTDS
jgi:hypothetical protein